MELHMFILCIVALPSVLSYSITPFIVGGEDAEPHSAPYLVTLRDPDFGHACGGAILSAIWILSANHCFHEDFTISVVAGEHEISVVTGREQTRNVAQTFRYELDDIVMVRLETPLDIIPGIVETIKLPARGKIHSGTVTLHGWGSISRNETWIWPSVLQTVQMPIVPWAICKEIIDSIFGEGVRRFDRHVCTGPLTGQISVCYGDSGSPLVQIDEDGNVEQVGITSWIAADPCGQVNAPSVYVQVSAYIDWIEFIMANN